MIINTHILIETNKFPILPGEDEEIVNEGTYGKALCLYLEENVARVGLEAVFFCNEDWGWWFEVKQADFKLGLCIYAELSEELNSNPKRYLIVSSVTDETQWSWRKLRKVNVSNKVTSVLDAIETTFKTDNEVITVKRLSESPF